MTLNGTYFAFFIEFDSFTGQFLTVVEDRPYLLPFTFSFRVDYVQR